ncbi:SagB/ThcOx family dehydrogenase [Alcaligenaceae bacterium]|nr:SagB/ThcOx family dehydrogenase [Alcaligenaceae bacterium]
MNSRFASSPDPHSENSCQVEPATPSSTTTDLAALQRLLRLRRSCRDYSGIPISLEAVRYLAEAAQGPVQKVGARTAPSAHAVYPLQLYILVRQVEGIEPGFYRYSVVQDEQQYLSTGEEQGESGNSQRHRLHALHTLPQTLSLVTASLAEDTWLDTAAAIIVIAADRQRAIQHFADQSADGQRGARYVDIEVGAVIQNLYLVTTALGLGGVAVMGFDEARMQQLLRLEAGFDLVALYCVGDPALPGASPKAGL